ncbi:hypothetical protein [Streptomyces sp. enrichment culture]|uniref:hypothetical protein n=1 Tax=Streptomyces sp. enrichment culture TaxID=1795815 RepID=UPI003F575C9D
MRDGLLAGMGYRMPQAAFLAWLDRRAPGLEPDPYTFFRDEARVLLNDGRAFGPGGAGFVRLDFATPRDILEDIPHRIRESPA